MSVFRKTEKNQIYNENFVFKGLKSDLVVATCWTSPSIKYLILVVSPPTIATTYTVTGDFLQDSEYPLHLHKSCYLRMWVSRLELRDPQSSIHQTGFWESAMSRKAEESEERKNESQTGIYQIGSYQTQGQQGWQQQHINGLMGTAMWELLREPPAHPGKELQIRIKLCSRMCFRISSALRRIQWANLMIFHHTAAPVIKPVRVCGKHNCKCDIGKTANKKKKSKNLAKDMKNRVYGRRPMTAMSNPASKLEKVLKPDKPAPEEVLSWAESLLVLLSHKYNLVIFRCFLQKELHLTGDKEDATGFERVGERERVRKAERKSKRKVLTDDSSINRP
ncbi:hypothetical protein DNTS_010870 [Danionella cerebrum]|uniref:Uncharacterized protein n=1 Tax=Danionella cerebrum TaxID=2873325 RepID=A0A553NL32_9TELE|nr:hypothetical protein DNTS_010870 [Danionella translucida]